jgi:hypothetical protein
MLHELETVVLTRDIPEHSLLSGDVGAIVHCHGDGEHFEVEFVTAEGQTMALLTLKGSDIRRMQKSEILHARKVEAA